MKRILVAVDGSQYSDRAIEYLLQHRLKETDAESVEVHLLNVQRPVSGDVATFVDKEELTRYHHDEGLKDLESARQTLDAAGVPYLFHVAVGEPGQIVASFAKERQCTEIIMGTHGRSGLTHLLLGSVSSDVIRLSDIPVVLVK